MAVRFNVSRDVRKKMIRAIEKELGVNAKYLGVPSCAFQIGEFRVTPDGTLSWEETTQMEKVRQVVDVCQKEIDNPQIEADEFQQDCLTISVPKEDFTAEAIENLFCILKSKGQLFQSAFLREDLKINVLDDRIEFPWFAESNHRAVETYTKFITAICEMAKKQKRISAKPKDDENKKYAFRCFLLRLGFIGDEFKADRKILLANLDGSSAFRMQKEAGE